MSAAEAASGRRRGGAALQWLWYAFGALVLVLVWRVASHLDWREVGAALAQRRGAELALIAAVAIASHALYGLLDAVARDYAGHRIARWRCWLSATVCYALGLNLGALVGGVGLRYRLYQRQGADAAAASRVIGASIAANWVGYLGLFALLPLWASLDALTRWVGRGAALALSLAAALLFVGYVVACARQPRVRLRGRELQFPPLRTALLQIAVAAANWALMGCVLALSLGGEVGYGDALAVLLVAAVAGVVTHVPGGWGVLDFVVVSMLSHQVAVPTLVAGVLVYRAAYYLLPLALSGPSYLALRRGMSAAPIGHGASAAGARALASTTTS